MNVQRNKEMKLAQVSLAIVFGKLKVPLKVTFNLIPFDSV